MNEQVEQTKAVVEKPVAPTAPVAEGQETPKEADKGQGTPAADVK